MQSEEEVQEHLTRIRKQYYDARHHCSAYVLGEKKDRKKASDDGEPQGSAGLPILNVIEGAGCTGILIVVTRYFGGTLLGTGGLVRAYTNAAKVALADAGPVCMKEERFSRFRWSIPFWIRCGIFWIEKEFRAKGLTMRRR